MQFLMEEAQAIISRDDDRQLKSLIDQSGDGDLVLEVADEVGNNLLHLCSECCRLRCLELLLSTRGHKYVNRCNRYGRTPLHLACFYGLESVVERLLSVEGIEADRPTHAGCTPLYFACCRGNASVVKRLLKSGANPNIQTNFSSTPLIAAAVNGNKALVEALLGTGANVNVQNKDGMSAIHVAAESNNRELMELLVVSGGDPNMKDQQGRTPNDVLALAQKKPMIEAAPSALLATSAFHCRNELKKKRPSAGFASETACSVDGHLVVVSSSTTIQTNDMRYESSSSPHSNPLTDPSSLAMEESKARTASLERMLLVGDAEEPKLSPPVCSM